MTPNSRLSRHACSALLHAHVTQIWSHRDLFYSSQFPSAREPSRRRTMSPDVFLNTMPTRQYLRNMVMSIYSSHFPALSSCQFSSGCSRQAEIFSMYLSRIYALIFRSDLDGLAACYWSESLVNMDWPFLFKGRQPTSVPISKAIPPISGIMKAFRQL
jgi:hypothetical protein